MTDTQITDKREYTLAIVGADDLWNEYLIMTVVNKYDNIFTGKIFIISVQFDCQ